MSQLRANQEDFGILPAVLVIAVLLSACATRGATTAAAGSVTQHSTSGIRGQVFVGPTCPVDRGQPCERPYATTIAVDNVATGKLVARVRSGASGRFSVALAAGRYLLVPAAGRPYPRSSPLTTTVRRDHYTPLVIHYFSGIRSRTR